MSDYKLTIHMNGVEAHVYDGEQAQKIFKLIDAAAMRGVKQAYVSTRNKLIIYNLENICAIEYRTKS